MRDFPTLLVAFLNAVTWHPDSSPGVAPPAPGPLRPACGYEVSEVRLGKTDLLLKSLVYQRKFKLLPENARSSTTKGLLVGSVQAVLPHTL